MFLLHFQKYNSHFLLSLRTNSLQLRRIKKILFFFGFISSELTYQKFDVPLRQRLNAFLTTVDLTTR